MTPRTPAPLPSGLLAERAWLRGLARSVVVDPTRAEDLEQDVWLSTLERRPAAPSNVRAWLARVLRNRATDVHRADERRRTRERAAAKPELCASTLDTVSRAEAYERLARAVVDLPDAYRAPIVLRYYDGLPPREIATRMGIPVATVRTRIARGLSRLRATMDAEHRGDRRAWSLALLGGTSGRTRRGVRRLTTAGALVMGAVHKSAAVALVVLVTALGVATWAVWTAEEDEVPVAVTDPVVNEPAPTRSKPERTSRPKRGEGRRSSPTPGDVETDPTPREAESAEATRVRVVGRIASGEGEAEEVAGRTVTLTSPSGSRWTAVTQVGGRFEIPDVDSGGPYAVSIDGAPVSTRRTAGLVISPRVSFNVGTLWLGEPPEGSVQIRDADGAAVGGARVDLFAPPPATGKGTDQLDVAGRFELLAEPPAPVSTIEADEFGTVHVPESPDGSWIVGASANGLARAVRRNVHPGTNALSLELPAGHDLTGRVVGTDGAPLAGVALIATTETYLYPPDRMTALHAVTDDDGRYSFPDLGGATVTLLATRGTRAPVIVAQVDFPNETTRDLVLGGGTISGRVMRSPTGAPMEGVRVEVVGAPQVTGALSVIGHSLVGVAYTDADGRYDVTPLVPAHVIRLTVRHPDVAESIHPESAFFLDHGGEVVRDFDVFTGGELHGRVVTIEGPLPSTTVWVWTGIESGGHRPLATKTDAQGRYRVVGVPPGRVYVEVSHPEFDQPGFPEANDRWTVLSGDAPPIRYGIDVPAGEAAELEVRLVRASGAIEGCVLGPGGKPQAGVSVYAPIAGSRVGSTETDENGEFRIEGVRTRSAIRVRVVWPGFAETDSPQVRVVAGETTKDVTIQLREQAKRASALPQSVLYGGK